MSEGQTTGYKTAFKATALFGGVQVFRVIINMLRFKLIAVILGPSGFGLIGIYNSIISFVQATSSFGLASSAVRDISCADIDHKPKIVTALYQWFFGTGILGALLMIFLSPIISKWSFENYYHILSIILLSIAVFFQTVNNGELAILQGYRDLKSIAKVNILGSVIGLFVSLPMYLIWEEDGIIPSLIVSSFLLFLISNFYVRKLNIKYEKKTIKESFNLGKQALHLGLMLSLSAIMVSLVELVVKSFLSRTSGTEIVGFYQAGWTMNTSYIGLVLAAMSTDYFPRLSTVINDKADVQKVVTQQLEIALIILGPLITIMLTFLPFFVIVLYSNEFLSIVPMTMIMLLGAIFKTVSWAISYVFLAKGDGKLFFLNELIINIVVVITSLLFFNIWGLIGIGVAYSLNYFLYFLLVYLRAKKIYDFRFTHGFWALFFKYCLLCFLTYLVLFYLGFSVKGYIVGTIFSIISIFVAFRDLNERVNVNSLVKKILKK